jgi:hypothetical protein
MPGPLSHPGQLSRRSLPWRAALFGEVVHSTQSIHCTGCPSSAGGSPLSDAASEGHVPRVRIGPFSAPSIAIKEVMGKLILLIALVPGVAAANDLPKNTQPKPKAPQAAANPCAQYGPGFVQVQGSTTCVKTNGYVRTDAVTHGRPR